MKITFFETTQFETEFLEDKFPEHEVINEEKTLSIENADNYKESEIISPFINSVLNPEILNMFPSLKFIATRSTGYDHIDINYSKSKNIQVSNVPHYGENTVAEHTFALILSLSRNVHKSYVRALKDDFEINDLVGFDLKEKTFGVIGTGSIGMHVIRIARGFGMNVIAFSRTKDKFMAEVLGYSYCDSFDELLKQSDILSFHVPLTDETRHMLNKDNIYNLKKGSIIVNTARGEVIDTEALYQALKNGHVGGAGLDVIEGEKYIREDYELIYKNNNPQTLQEIFRDKEIFKMDNVVFTPHNAFNSKEAILRIIETTVDNIKAFIESKNINQIA